MVQPYLFFQPSTAQSRRCDTLGPCCGRLRQMLRDPTQTRRLLHLAQTQSEHDSLQLKPASEGREHIEELNLRERSMPQNGHHRYQYVLARDSSKVKPGASFIPRIQPLLLCNNGQELECIVQQHKHASDLFVDHFAYDLLSSNKCR